MKQLNQSTIDFIFEKVLNLPFNKEDIINFKCDEDGENYLFWIKDGRKYELIYDPAIKHTSEYDKYDSEIFYKYPVSCYTPWVLINHSGYWQCLDGRILKVREMTDRHYINCVKLSYKKYQDNLNPDIEDDEKEEQWISEFRLASLANDPRFHKFFRIKPLNAVK